MGKIIKFQHEVYNGTLDGSGKPDIDILYPKTSADMVDGLQAFVSTLFTDTTVTAVTIVAGTSTTRPKIRITPSNGATIESGEITLATTGVYGATRLSSAVNSTSEVLAATSKAVKTAYDLANMANANANTANTHAQNAVNILNQLIENLNGLILQVVTISGIKVEPKTGTVIDLTKFKIYSKNIVDVIAFGGEWENLTTIVREGVSFSIRESLLHINTTASMILTIKVLYNSDLP